MPWRAGHGRERRGVAVRWSPTRAEGKGRARRAGPACRPGERGEAGVGLGREKRKRKLGRAEKSGEKGKGKEGKDGLG